VADVTDDPAAPPWTHHQAVLNDVHLHYVAAGPPDGDLVVCLHGFPAFWYTWHEAIPALADAGYRVVAPDMRGYNRSAKPRGVAAYRMDELVGDVVGLIEHAGRQTAHVVGHDWGALVAWHLAAERPGVVDRLAILNAPHPSAYERELRSNPRQLLRSWYVLVAQVPRLPEYLLSRNDAALVGRLFARAGVDGDAFSPAEVTRYREAFARPGVARASLNYYRAAVRETLRRLPRGGVGDLPIAAPTLVVWGEQDPALSVSVLDGLDRWAADLTVERLPVAGHWALAEAPECVVRSLLAFFAGEDVTAPSR